MITFKLWLRYLFQFLVKSVIKISKEFAIGPFRAFKISNTLSLTSQVLVTTKFLKFLLTLSHITKINYSEIAELWS